MINEEAPGDAAIPTATGQRGRKTHSGELRCELKESRAERCLKRVNQSFPRQVKRGQVTKCLLMRLF